MLLYTMLYIVLAYLMLFAALTNSVCLNNASFFFLFKYFLCQGYELSGEIALKNNHYYYYYIQTHHSSNQNVRYSFLLHCPCQHFFQYSVKSFLLVQKTHTQLFSFSTILLMQPSQDKYSINCSFLGHKTKFHLINSHYSTKSSFKHPFHHLQIKSFMPL